MKKADTTDNGTSQLSTLSQDKSMGSEVEQILADLTWCLQRFCHTTIAMLNLKNPKRVWLTSTGQDQRLEIPQDNAFCTATLSYEGIFEVSDASKDPRFADNAVVIQMPQIRFYMGTALKSPDGESFGTLCAIDTRARSASTEEKEALRKLARQVETYVKLTHIQATARSSQLTDQLISTVSHDFKNPIHAINNLSQWIAEDCQEMLPPESIHHLKLIQNRAERLSKLTNAVVKYCRLAKLSWITRTVRLDEVITHIRKELDLPDSFVIHVPQTSIIVAAEPFTELLARLIENAYQHNNLEHPECQITCHQQRSNYVIKIKDNGPGIEEEYHQRVFDIAQTLTKTDLSTSSGMGLAIAHRIMQLIDGHIEIQQAGGAGATFVIYWPCEQNG